HERQEGVALGLGTAAVRLEQDDVDVVPRGADGDPAEAVGRHVVADIEPECVAVEAQRGVGVVDGDEHCRDGDCHARTIRGPPVVCFSDPARCWRRPGMRAQTLTGVRRGRVATMLTHDGTTWRSRWSRARYRDGVSPTISVKRELNEPSDVQPTARQVSVTDSP